MRKYLIIILLLIFSVCSYGQVSPASIKRVQSSTTVFIFPLRTGDIVADISTGKTYRLLKAIAGTNSLSTLVDGVDYKELTSTIFDDQLRIAGSMAYADIKDFPQLKQYNVFTDSLVVPNVAFNATTWNASNGVPTKNAIRDEIIRYRLLSNHDSLSQLDEKSYNSLTDKPTIPTVSPSNVTAGSTKITLGGTPTGAALQAFSVDVDQAKIDHNSLLNFDARKHFYKQSIDSVSTGLSTGLLKTTNGKLSSITDNSAVWNAVPDSLSKHSTHYYSLRDSVRLNISNIAKLNDSIAKHTDTLELHRTQIAGKQPAGDYATNTALGTKLDTTKATYNDRLHWTTAYSDRMKWDGGSTGLVAATGRTSLGLGTAAVANLGTGASDAAYGNHTHTGVYETVITKGTTAQYFRGDMSLATFPTNVSSFTNDAGYVTSASISAPNNFAAPTAMELAKQNGYTYKKSATEVWAAPNSTQTNPHATLIVGNYYYVMTRTSPTVLYRFNIDDLSTYTSITFPNLGLHSNCDQMIYVNNKIYIAFGGGYNYHLSVVQVNPTTITDTTTVINYHSTAFNGGLPFTTDGTYMYICSDAGAGMNYADSIFKYRISDWSLISKCQVTSGSDKSYPHAIGYDGSNLYVTTTCFESGQGYLNRVYRVGTACNATPTEYLNIYSSMCDEFAIEGDRLYIGKETSDGWILTIDKSASTMTRDSIFSGQAVPCYGVFTDGSQVWCTMSGSPGGLSKIDPYTNSVSTMTFPSGYNLANELNFEGGRIFVSFYQQYFRIMRMMTPKMTPVDDGLMKSITVTLSAAEIGSLYSSPKIVVPAPGAGKYIKVISADVFYDFVSAHYGNYTDLQLFNSGAVCQYSCESVLSASSDHFRSFLPTTYSASSSTTILSNSALLIGVPLGNPINGDSTAKLYLTYRIITL